MHNVLITAICWMVVAFACSDDDYMPVSDTKVTYFRWYFSYECRRMPNELYGQAIMFACGHIVWDVIRLAFYDTDWKPIDRQMLFHHFIAGVGIFFPMLAGFGAPAIATNLLLTENSSVYLSIRSMLPKELKGSPIILINNALLVLNFTFFRILLMPLILYWCYEEARAVMKLSGFWVTFEIIPSLLAVVLYGLNWFWFWKIVKVAFMGQKIKEDSKTQEAQAIPTD